MRKCEFLSLLLFMTACGAGDDYRSKSLSTEFAQSAQESRISLVDPGKTGPYKVLSYTPKNAVSGFKSAIVYYPGEDNGTLLPATTLTGGFTNTKEQMSWLGKHLASHGVITIVFTPTSNTVGSAQIWANGHKASLETLVKEDSSRTSPLYGRINLQRMGVSGYSYGGAGAILAANQSPDLVAAAVPLSAYQPSRPVTSIPYLFVTGTRDTVASPTAVLNVFKNTSTGQPKAFARFNGVSHFDFINGGRYHESIARFVTAWTLRFLGENAEYGTYVNGDMAKKQAQDKTVFATVNDYRYED